MKFEKQGRYCMGVAMRKPICVESNEEMNAEGVRLTLFDYTNREVLSISKYDQKLNEEIRRVKGLTGGEKAGWIRSNRPNAVLFEDDPVKEMKGVGPAAVRKLLNAGIQTVKDIRFKELLSTDVDSKLKVMSEIPDSPTLSTLKKLHLQSKTAIAGSAPAPINHSNAQNPYLSRYGEENWRKEIEKVSYMKKYCCICELVTHIHDKTRDAFKGTRYEQTYLFYHDALITMTDKDCLAWMEEKGYLERWILPVLGCNNEIIIENENGVPKINKNYKGRPVGDCMELMPLDNSLFRDLRTCFDMHVTLTSILPSTDLRRFSKSTPKCITSSISRIWDPETGVSPSSNRIIQDILRVKENIELVVEAGGAIVPGVCDRNGHRRTQRADGLDRRGKYDRDKMDSSQVPEGLESMDLHSDCKQVCSEFYNGVKVKYALRGNADETQSDGEEMDGE